MVGDDDDDDDDNDDGCGGDDCIKKQDKPCTYNVTMRHIRLTIVVVEEP